MFKLQDGESKGSLFATTISKNQPKTSTFKPDEEKKEQLQSTSLSSRLISGSWAKEIHNENLEKLKEMGTEQIMAEKKILETMLSSSSLAFIKSLKDKKVKSKGDLLNLEKISSDNSMEVDEDTTTKLSKSCSSNIKQEKNVVESENNLSQKMEVNFEDVSKDLPEPVVEIVKDATEKGWCHMDDVETEKLKWMQDLTETETNARVPEEPYNARFDFTGNYYK